MKNFFLGFAAGAVVNFIICVCALSNDIERAGITSSDLLDCSIDEDKNFLNCKLKKESIPRKLRRAWSVYPGSESAL